MRRDYLAKGLAMRDELRDEPLLSFCLAPHAPYTVSRQDARTDRDLRGELDLPVHMHVHETLDEIKREPRSARRASARAAAAARPARARA